MSEADSIFGADPDQLRELIQSGLEAGDTDSLEGAPASETAGGPIERPGTRIGRYKLLCVLGEGGMGMVHLAEQEGAIRRKVALKVIKPGMDSKRVIARFETERQALALLDHPGIAQVYDAGTTKIGRPYFVMEYVKGSPITDYCDRHKLSIEERLRLFQQVCDAVQHAHQKGIIHRDIKPSNILVSAEGDKAIPKIIDFGVAKAMSQPLTERTLFTEDSQLLGTPEYMSPEQAEMVNEDIDTRSDIYSLGVLLYVLLGGALPFDSATFREGGVEHVRRVIRETDPKTPSTRLTKLGEEAEKVAENRRTEVAALAKRLSKELEWIPLKAMRKERSQRYRSASEFADDIENYLKGEALIAGPPTARYRLQKFLRRNKRVFVGVVVVVAALVIGLGVSAVSLVRERNARRAAVVAQENEAGLRRQAQANELDMRRIAYASDMSLAQQALAMDDVGRAQRLLDAHRPAPGEVDLRGWEWRHLWRECRSDALGELFQYPYPVYSVAYSPDGTMLAVAGVAQACVDIWDASGHKRIRTLQPESGHCVAFSPRGDLLATNVKDEIQLWRTSTWDPVGQLRLAGDVAPLKFSPDGTRLASLSFSDEDGSAGELTVWEVDQRAVVRRISGLRVTGSPSNLDFSPDGQALVVGQCDCRLQVIDVASGKTIFGVSEAHPEQITTVAWSPDDSVIASGSGWVGGPIRLWDAASGRLLGKLQGHTSWICDLAFSRDGLRLYSASGDQTIRIWDVAHRGALAILRGSSHEVLGLALSPDGTTLASACKDGAVAFWSAAPQPQEEMPRLIPVGDSAQPVFAPDSRVLAVPQAGTVGLFDLATFRETKLSELGGDVSAVAYSPDGTLLVSGSENGIIRVWSFVEHRLLRELDGHKKGIGLLRFRADGMRLLSLDAAGRVIGWDALKWHADRTFDVEGPVRWRRNWWPVDVSPDGRLMAFGAQGVLQWLSIQTGELLETTTGVPLVGATGVAFSSDGLWVASTDRYGTVALWDASSFRLEAAFRAHLLGARGPAFSPDGRRLVTSGASRDAVRLWDLSSRRELITLPGKGVFSFVAFSPDNNWLAAYSPDNGKLHLWRAPSWEEIEAEEESE